MAPTSANLFQIVENASTLAERLRGDFEPARSDSALAQSRLLRWRQLAADNDPARFNRVLQSYGVINASETDLLGKLGAVKKKPDSSLPAWASLLEALVKSISRDFSLKAGDGTGKKRGLEIRGRIPYQHLFDPVARLAWSRVGEFHPALCASLAPGARRGLQNYLLRRISNIVALPLHAMFLAHNAIRHAISIANLVPGSEIVTGVLGGRRQYQTFVASQGEDGLHSFFMRHPVAARLTAEVTHLWIEFVQEFLGRLNIDRQELAAAFNDGAPLGKLLDVQAGVSDPHRGGRSVLLLTFEGNLRLAYKPRPIEIDQVFFRLVEELNQASKAPDVRGAKIFARESYGWMEFIPHDACRSQQAIRRYYRRAGALSCVLHWLHAIDCHRENLIAYGEYPVLTDLETIAHLYSEQEYAKDIDGTPWSLDGSVLRTGLLPLWYVRPTGTMLNDNSGIGASTRQRSPMPTFRWDRVNTDRMAHRYGYWLAYHRTHCPHWNNRLFPVRNCEANVLGGYAQMAKLLSGPMAKRYLKWRERAFFTLRRRVKRPTLVYAYILQCSLSPGNLLQGVDRSIELQALPCPDNDDADERANEIASLEQQDIPYFQFGDTARNCTDSAESIPNVPHLFNQRKVMDLSLRRKLRLEQATICRM